MKSVDARSYRVVENLKDGTAVTVRAIRPDDKQRLDKAFRKLDPQSVYTRFFGQKDELTELELKAATEVDFENTVALVVTISEGEGDETIIGAGRYLVHGPAGTRHSAEIAFAVEEDYQGQGMASRILRHLAHIAREKGLSEFTADVLSRNRAMLAVFARSGLPMESSTDEGTVHVTLALEGPTASG